MCIRDKPLANRVILIELESNNLEIYKIVASPSILALVAMMSSVADLTRSIRESICKSSGQIPSNGESRPPKTWFTP